ncbi:MAG: alpha-2-macroglobulin, partial [Saprospiraceae bacterium]|nr:alpha-2-macroglobulin [Flavobacteriaceae bacterium]NNE27598.1 alpha-2-macroglobulin [Saprospiraceae bacterium]
SASTVINVGYHAMKLAISVDPKLDKQSKDHKITIDSKNLNNEFVSANGSIKIFKLEAPDQVLRPRPWLAPDYQDFSEEIYRKLFPHEPYGNEHDSNNWRKGKLVYSESFDTNKSKNIRLGNIRKWMSGQYIIVVEAKDKFGQDVRDEAKTFLYATNDKIMADNQLFGITTNKTQYNSGEKVLLQLGSATTLTVTVDIEKDQKIVDWHIIQLNNNKKTISIPVSDDDIGGFFIHYSFAGYNSFEGNSMLISVPYPSSELEIETLTFRDKLKPGDEELWSFKIKGPKGDKVAAELLAGMYDMSLDQFKPHLWNFNPIQRPIPYSYKRPKAGQSFNQQNFRVYDKPLPYRNLSLRQYDQLNWFGLYFGNNRNVQIRGYASGVMVTGDEAVEEMPMMMKADNAELDEVVIEGEAPITSEEIIVGAGTPAKEQTFDDVQVRKNLEETAFFLPQLNTDEEGNVSFSFKTPESLTRWKLQLLAHTKTLEHAITSLEAVTQKELMVIPNAPRFLREGDQIIIQSKISNISDNALSGQAVLQLFDATNGREIDAKLDNSDPVQLFSVDAKSNTNVAWSLSIPFDVQAVQYKVIAKAGDFSDGEQNALPVLSNRMLVTESMPMWIRSNQSKTFTLDKLKTNVSTTLKHHNLTLEMTSNPAWYAVQALPYLMEFPYECNEQTFARFYANALATHIANSNPRIQEVFNQWRNTDALLSNLEKNQELKSLLIQETPWLRDAQSETEQKKRIALLFDLNKMKNEMLVSVRKLQNNQMQSGAWPWFNGGRANRSITQHIVAGMAHLEHLNGFEIDENSASIMKKMLVKALPYLDGEFVKEYQDIRKYNKDVDLSKDHLTSSQLHYLYLRSFFPERKVSKEVQSIIEYYKSQIRSYWLKRSLYQKGLMALIMHRSQDNTTSSKLLNSLKENSITSEELGMYWKENTNSWYWYQAPVETQALLIEAFTEIENETETIDNLKIWLLKNKQTNRWKSTKATTEAVYALLLQGSDWLSVTDMVDIVLGNKAIDPQKLEDVKVEAGTGYFKTSWSAAE